LRKIPEKKALANPRRFPPPFLGEELDASFVVKDTVPGAMPQGLT
jgi:hypothetical protein